ncbi:MAG: DUF512 domain-containing protein [Firmicutes bacterium]|nr:DUF512 domain-containing protein [Bacillota bacterium]
MGAVISRVELRSIAQRYGFRVNDEVITINGQLLRDIIDYHFLTAEHKLEINFVRDGMPYSTVIHKDESDTLGLDFKDEIFDEINTCRNKCIFCFVDQLPADMRSSLFIKDDDYRLSFLHGNYITLTNISENDLRRITAQRLSPLYVSVHATDPEVREQMMGSSNSGAILKYLEKLKTHNIQCHAQVVVVPGVNDGKVLKKTLQDLYNLHPTVKTVAVVPVGLTRYHKCKNEKTDKKGQIVEGSDACTACGSCKKGHEIALRERVRLMRPSEAQQIFEMVTKFQAKAQKFFKYAFFYLSDEFYLIMNKELPRHTHYGFFEQIGNGVGLARKMITDFNRRRRYFPNSLDEKRNVWIITGVLGEKVIKPLVAEFAKIKKLKTRLMTVKNDFFGHEVTVTGLLTGQDIKKNIEAQLKKSVKPDVVIFPDVLLHEGKFLDDVTPEQIAEELDINITAVETSAIGMIEMTLGITRKNVPEELEGEDGPEVIYADEMDEDEDYQDEMEEYDEEEENDDDDIAEDDGEPETHLPDKDIEITAKI